MVRLAAGKLEDKGINVEFLLYLSQSVHKFIPGFGRLGVANLGKHVGTVVQHIDAYHVRQLNQLASYLLDSQIASLNLEANSSSASRLSM